MTLIVLLLIIFLVPVTRYKILGLFVKEKVAISVIDSSTNSPVANAHVQVGNVTTSTSDEGKAYMVVPVGNANFDTYKQYYKDQTDKLIVTFDKSRDSLTIRLTAIGREVPIRVVNKITNQPIIGASVKVLYSKSKTDKNGETTIVLPVDKPSQKGVINIPGYNSSNIVVQVTGHAVAANTFPITPSGQVYFLSNLSGKIDVVKTNLDGSGRQTVLAGTGNETPSNTVLLASRDWKYLALYAQRSSTGNPEIDLVDTSTDTMSNIDEGNATFTVLGWDGDYFIYEVTRNDVPLYQADRQVIKSFDAQTKTIKVLAQTANGINWGFGYYTQSLDNVYLVNSQIIYSLEWSAIDTSAGEHDTINTINADGSNSSVIKDIDLNSITFNNSFYITPYDEPNDLAVQISQDSIISYYEYQNGQLKPSNELNSGNIYQFSNYPTFLQSPNGNQTFWSEPTDGKNTLFVGDQYGNNSKKIAILSDYSPYGWFTDNYLLVSKNSSELYIMPVTGGTPIPISDYFKSSQFYISGYGGGYGAL